MVGYHFKDFFEGELFEEHLRQVLDGQAPGFSDVAYEINGFALLASILPIRDGEEIAGIIVKFRNIEDIRTTIMERNTAIAAAERKYRESSERSLPEEEGSLQTYGSSAAMRAVRRRPISSVRWIVIFSSSARRAQGGRSWPRAFSKCSPGAALFFKRIALPWRRVCWRSSCSAEKAAYPVPSWRPTAVRCCWTKWAACL